MIKKISIDQLRTGMYIADLNNQWVPASNASRCGLIKDDIVIKKIKKLGVTEIYIDTEKGCDCEECGPADAIKQVQNSQYHSISSQSGTLGSSHISVTEEYENAEKSYSKARNVVGSLLNDIKNGKLLNAEIVEDTAEDLIVSLHNNENALACLSFIRSKDDYLLEHSINVGVLLGIFARAQRIEGDVLRQLVAGGILHDIGKVLVPSEILNKPDKLDPQEWEEMKRHVSYGEQILDVTRGLPDITRSICRLHHERLDGTGYPRGLAAEEITTYGRMAAICDVYDAITADRVYHAGMSPNDAMRKLVEWSVFHLDKELVYDFIRCMSAYPVGTLVQLNNNQAGVIIEANRRLPKQPKIRICYDISDQQEIKPSVKDLSLADCSLEITGTLDCRELGLDIRPFL